MRQVDEPSPTFGMRPIQPRLKGFKTQAPPLFEASEDLNELGHEVIRLDVPKEFVTDVLDSPKAEDPSRLENQVNFKIRPTKRHPWRALNAVTDPFDDPLH